MNETLIRWQCPCCYNWGEGLPSEVGPTVTCRYCNTEVETRSALDSEGYTLVGEAVPTVEGIPMPHLIAKRKREAR